MRVCSKVCNECPFSNTSLRGWLGPHSIEEIMDHVQWEIPFSCHLHRDDSTSMEDIISGKIPVCRGFILCANKSCKLFGQNPEYGEDLKKLQQIVSLRSEDEDLSTILNKMEFRKHHESYR